MLEECPMSWTAWNPGKAENWFAASLSLKRSLRWYGVKGVASAVPPVLGHSMLRASLYRHRMVPGVRKGMMLKQPWACQAVVESSVPLQLQSAKPHHLPWWPLPSSESGDVSIPPASLTLSTSTKRAAREAQVSKGYSSGPRGSNSR